MGGKDFQEEVMLAAVKPLKAVNSTMPEGPKSVPLRQLSVEDSNSLEGLFERHHDRVFRTAYRVTGSAAAAENAQAYFARARAFSSIAFRARQSALRSC
jgi:hypothetical protein